MSQPKPAPTKLDIAQDALTRITDLADYAAALSRIGAHVFSDAEADLFARDGEDWPHEATIRDVRLLFEIVHRLTADVYTVASDANWPRAVDYPSWRKEQPRAFTTAGLRATRP